MAEEGQILEDEEIVERKRKRDDVCALGDFAILRKLGEGTFGEVSLAKRLRTGEQYALKRILTNQDSQPDGVCSMEI